MLKWTICIGWRKIKNNNVLDFISNRNIYSFVFIQFHYKEKSSIQKTIVNKICTKFDSASNNVKVMISLL
jgi:hypothetical protein